jgi:hypothetical protein
MGGGSEASSLGVSNADRARSSLPRVPSPPYPVAEIEMIAEPGERQAKHDYGRPEVTGNEKARSRKKQGNGGGPVPEACKARQHQRQCGARHHHPANR